MMLALIEQSFEFGQNSEYLGVLSGLLSSFLKFFSNAQLSTQFYQGGVGYIVAAVMQTKGLMDQSKILANFSELKEIAALFYLFGVGMAIGAIAVFGNYRQAVYFLIGPALFQFATTVTVPTDGVHARIGQYTTPNDIGQEKSFLESIKAIGPDDGQANISILFATIDEITTEVIQVVTASFLDTKNRDHLRYVGRENALAYVMLGIEDSTGLSRLLISGFKAGCHEVFTKSLQIGSGHQTKVPKREASLSPLEQVRQDQNKVAREKMISLDFEMKEYLKVNKGQAGFEGVPDFRMEDPLIVSCEDTWKWVAAGFKQLAGERLEDGSFKGLSDDPSDFPWPKIYDDLNAFIAGGGGNGSAKEVLAAYIMKNTMALTTHNMLESQVFSHSPMNAKQAQLFIGDIGEVERHGGYMYMKYFAGSIPYLQGLLLYLLCIAYPFFAILLVMPSKASSFFVWFSLWVWVKSWDLGFALVYVVRDMYWDILKHRVNGFKEVINWDDPGSIFALAMHNDPLASQNTYWLIMSFLTVSVPFLTAQFCFGASNMFDMFRMGIDKTAGRFRNFEIQRGRRHLGNSLEQSFRDRANEVANQYGMAAFNTPQSSASNPHGLQNAFGESIGSDKLSDLGRGGGGLVGGAQARKAASARAVGLGLVHLATPELKGMMEQNTSQIRNFEKGANSNAPAGAKSYTLPTEFTSAASKSQDIGETLNSKVDVSTQNAIIAREEGGLMRDKQNPSQTGKEGLTWGQFLDERADAKGESVVIPDLMRGMPSLSDAVPQEALAKLYSPDDEYRNGEKVTWGQLFEREADDQLDRYASLAAVVGRRFAPAIQTGGGNFFEAAKSESISSMMYGGALDGAGANYLPGVKPLVERMKDPEQLGNLLDSLYRAKAGSDSMELPSATSGPQASEPKLSGE